MDGTARKFRERNLDGVSLKYLDVGAVLESCRSDGTLPSKLLQNLSNSDLLPGIYEGGFKIWDCSWDLCSFVSKLSLEGKEVLEVGCGAGLPGITSLLSGAKSVSFQDFNAEVLDQLTKKNLCLNGDFADRTSFFSGDWSDVAKRLGSYNQKFDIVITSETIYQPKSYQKLCELFTSALKPNGVVYVAAKLYYFGVDGNVPEFEGFVKDNTTFSIQEVFTTESDIPRVILELKWKD